MGQKFPFSSYGSGHMNVVLSRGVIIPTRLNKASVPTTATSLVPVYWSCKSTLHTNNTFCNFMWPPRSQPLAFEVHLLYHVVLTEVRKGVLSSSYTHSFGAFMKLMSFEGNLGERGFRFISENHLLWLHRYSHPWISFALVLSNRNFCDDRNTLTSALLVQSLLAPCDFQTLKTWPV